MARMHEYPLTCCDWECAAANGCREGGYQCADCGCWFCVEGVTFVGDECLCDDCAERRTEEREEEEQEDDDGE